MSGASRSSATDGGVRRLILNRPDKRNALNAELVAALKAALREADADDAVRVVAIEGAGKDFCSGADLSALRKIAESSVMENLEDVDDLAELFLLPRRMRKPVVACVRGRALAGGCGLATACDMVLAAETAEFGYPEVRIGFVPAMVMAILRRNVSGEARVRADRAPAQPDRGGGGGAHRPDQPRLAGRGLRSSARPVPGGPGGAQPVRRAAVQAAAVPRGRDGLRGGAALRRGRERGGAHDGGHEGRGGALPGARVIDRTRREPDFYLDWKIRLFFTGAVLVAAGVVFGQDVLVLIAIILLVVGLLATTILNRRRKRAEATMAAEGDGDGEDWDTDDRDEENSPRVG